LVSSLLLACAVCTVTRASEAVFVQNGQARSAQGIGNKWTYKDGSLVCGGKDNFLVAGKAVGTGDFRICARLSLERFDGTAASLAFGQNHFGFDSRSGRLFVEGAELGRTRSVGNTADFIQAGKPFDVEVVRQGNTITFRIGGKEVHRGEYRLDAPMAIALRPWRATMAVSGFSASGNLVDVTADAIAKLRRDWKLSPPKPAGLLASVVVGGMKIDATAPPVGLVVRPQLGLLTSTHVDGQLVHEAETNLFETRATITPGGDYLLMFPEGAHYGGKKGKVNNMIAYRSSDKGKTWSDPTVAFDIDYSQHGFIPLIPRGSKRIYAFGTQPIEGKREGAENCPIGFRYSDDDGHTWSEVTLIKPVNNPDFLGMSVMRMCETDAATWLLGSHEGRWVRKPNLPVVTRAYVLRSEDQGKTWTVLPDKRPGGWYLKQFERMDEPRPINLGGGRAMILARTCEGHLWASWSEDDGRTWSEPKPTSLIHPDAPPMLFHHPDGKTLVALHHNRHSGSHFKQTDRSEIWVSLSTDEGRTWSEPRFIFANALAATSNSPWHDHQCSYVDAFVEGDTFHLFVPHRWKRALHLTLNADDIERLPTSVDLRTAPRVEKTLLFEAGQDGYAVFRIPGIVATAEGSLLAYCVGRKAPGDWADIDIFLRRSTDGGKTWEPRKKLGDVGSSTVDNPTAIVDRKTGAVHMLYQVDYARAFYVRSDDDGRTFSEPVEVTSVFEEFRQEYDWNVIAPGPGHGLQLANGRLIVPVWLSTGGHRHRPSIVSVIYSDDHGRTWHRGDVVVRTDDEFINPSETVAVELTDGRVMLNIRNECTRHRRLVSFSDDGATKWTTPVFDETLFEAICFGSIQRLTWGTFPTCQQDEGTSETCPTRNRILFVNPNSGSRARKNLTVRLSYDEGQTWPVHKVLEPGIAGYSDLTVGPDGSIYCLYERGGLGGNHFHTQGITVAKFPLEWLTDGQDVCSQGERLREGGTK